MSVYFVKTLTGGISGDVGILDALGVDSDNGPETQDNNLYDGDVALYTDTSGNCWEYVFDASSTASESVPDIIRPIDFATYSGTWIRSPYGASSGLDADLLDGQHGSYYASLSTSGIAAHAASDDHDGRYYTEAEVDTISGSLQDQITSIPVDNFVRADQSDSMVGDYDITGQLTVDNVNINGNTIRTSTGDMILDAAGADISIPTAVDFNFGQPSHARIVWNASNYLMIRSADGNLDLSAPSDQIVFTDSVIGSVSLDSLYNNSHFVRSDQSDSLIGDYDITGDVTVSGTLNVSTGATGTFTSQDGKTVTVSGGIIVSIV